MSTSPTTSDDFDGRVALVTGASQGIGAGVAAAFVRAGASVAVAARTVDRLERVAAELRASATRPGQSVIAVPTDVTDPVAVRRLVERCVDELGRLDLAVNNATDGPKPARLADLPLDGFDVGIRTNVHGTFYGMKYQILAMLAGGGGAIVNLASVAGVSAVSHLGAYVSAKAGIIALSKSAALDYAEAGIRVNVVAPGPIRTEHIIAAGAEAQRQAAANVPMGRMGTVDDVAASILWLCSDRASFVTGVTLAVDGGQSAGTRLRRTYTQGEPVERDDVVIDPDTGAACGQ